VNEVHLPGCDRRPDFFELQAGNFKAMFRDGGVKIVGGGSPSLDTVFLAAQGKKAEARVAYQAAFGKMEKDNPYRSIVELKLDALGGETK